jgi:hypothetical protein
MVQTSGLSNSMSLLFDARTQPAARPGTGQSSLRPQRAEVRPRPSCARLRDCWTWIAHCADMAFRSSRVAPRQRSKSHHISSRRQLGYEGPHSALGTGPIDPTSWARLPPALPRSAEKIELLSTRPRNETVAIANPLTKCCLFIDSSSLCNALSVLQTAPDVEHRQPSGSRSEIPTSLAMPRPGIRLLSRRGSRPQSSTPA